MIRRTPLLVACFASAAGSGWVRRAHKRTQRNATRPQLQPVTSEDVSRYFAKNDLDGLCAALRDHFSHGAGSPGRRREAVPAPTRFVAKGAGAHYSSAYKLQQHDVEQLEYVAARNATIAAYLDEHAVIVRFQRVCDAAFLPWTNCKGQTAFGRLGPRSAELLATTTGPSTCPIRNQQPRCSTRKAGRTPTRGSGRALAVDDALTPAALARQIRVCRHSLGA